MADEKRHALKKEILEIEHNNAIYVDTDGIHGVFLQYYLTLLGTKAAVQDEECLRKLTALLPRLSENQIATLEEPISLPEIEAAVDALPQGKTPGPDGLRSEFYKLHKNSNCPMLQRIF